MGMPRQASPSGDAAQWPFHSFLPLGALPGAVPCARLHTTAVLWEWDMEELAHPAELAVSELVTNAVRASTQARAAGLPALADHASPFGPGFRLSPRATGTDGFYVATLTRM